jgi:hypothetical protein
VRVPRARRCGAKETEVASVDEGVDESGADDDDGAQFNWACCDRCDQWRRLPMCDQYEPENLPDRWFCEMNPGERNSCDKPEERMGKDEVCEESSATSPPPAEQPPAAVASDAAAAALELARDCEEDTEASTLSKEQPAAAEEEPAAAEGGGDAVPECGSDPDVCGLWGCTLSRLHKGLCNIGGNLDGRKRTASAARS